MRIVVAISGGVDSAVAAALLKDQGHDVVAVTLRLADLSEAGLGPSRCCSREDVALARCVAERLGIAHHLVDLQEAFRREVLVPFGEAYRRGETPSPCIRCNSRVKFGELLDIARTMGADVLATGHYARCEREENGELSLRRGSDLARDQSYFLFELRREQLDRVVFPLGSLRKDEVRELARAFGLPNAGRPDSQEVCFVPDGLSYADAMDRIMGVEVPPNGEVVDSSGRVLGVHRGIHRYTVGQRRGLGVGGRGRLYVTGIDAASNRIVVGRFEETLKRRISVRDVCWFVEMPGESFAVSVQIRSRHAPSPAVVAPDELGRAEITFDEPVAAPAPGQAAVCYLGDRVLGGGWITASA